MEAIGDGLLALAIMWVGLGLVLRFIRNVPGGYNSLPPGPKYDKRVAGQIDRQHQFIETWFRLWPIPASMFAVGVLLIEVR